MGIEWGYSAAAEYLAAAEYSAAAEYLDAAEYSAAAEYLEAAEYSVAAEYSAAAEYSDIRIFDRYLEPVRSAERIRSSYLLNLKLAFLGILCSYLFDGCLLFGRCWDIVWVW